MERGFRLGSNLPRRAPAPTLIEYGRMPSRNPAARMVRFHILLYWEYFIGKILRSRNFSFHLRGT